ncbi:hypothetical protein ABH994_007493 [Bradyrhizobium yuanmingense]|uniref:hypothetical protein n=1 Tax=Bradyrhizobium yuanmingense TaxID=108015 RepID=UPI003512857C
MAEYQLTATDAVISTADQALIPNDEANIDWQAYQQWLADGGVPDPYELPPEPEPPREPKDVVLYDHENRLRALEGQPPLSIEEFRKRR